MPPTWGKSKGNSTPESKRY